MPTGNLRPPIPEPVKRQLRQEAGFGCCKCGLPIYQYQHIIPYSQDHHFRPEDMMILCPNCHDEATKGAMTEIEQRRYKAQPYNIQNGYVEGSLKINQDFCAVNVGSNQFVGDGCFIRVNNDPLFSLGLGEHGGLELSITLYDRDDSLLAIIEKNEWISGDPLPWDIESSHQRLKIRRRTGDIAMEINARRMPINIRADLWKGGQNICLHDDILVDGVVVENVKFRSLCFVGIHLVIDTVPRTLHLVPDARYGQGAFVSWPDPAERIEKGRIAWLNLQSQGIRQQR